MPPLPLTWKNSLSANSQASAVWATNTRSRPSRTGGGCPAARRRRTSWRACARASSMLPETSSAKITAALVAGAARLTELAEAQIVVGEGHRVLLHARRLTASLIGAAAVQARARAALVPALAHVVRLVLTVARSLGFRSGSFSSSHSQSTMSSTLSSSTNWNSPSSVPPRRRPRPRSSAVAPGAACRRLRPAPWPAPAARRRRAGGSARARASVPGTSTVRSLRPREQVRPASRSGRLFLTASRTFSLWRSQSRAPRENRSYHGDLGGQRSCDGSRHAPARRAARSRHAHSCASSVVT